MSFQFKRIRNPIPEKFLNEPFCHIAGDHHGKLYKIINDLYRKKKIT